MLFNKRGAGLIMIRIIYLFPLLMWLSAPCLADGGWVEVGVERAGDDPSRFSVHRAISKVAVECLEGEIVIERVEVVSGENVTPFALLTRMKAGESQQVSVGKSIACDRLNIKASGQGRFKVRVRP